MSTRSMIAREKEGKITGIYCHWDGYIRNNGEILLNNYKTREDVEALISLKGISSLRETFEETKKTAYNDGTEPYFFESFKDLEYKMSKDYGIEYIYLFKDEGWLVFSYHFTQDRENFIAQGYELKRLFRK